MIRSPLSLYLASTWPSLDSTMTAPLLFDCNNLAALNIATLSGAFSMLSAILSSLALASVSCISLI